MSSCCSEALHNSAIRHYKFWRYKWVLKNSTHIAYSVPNAYSADHRTLLLAIYGPTRAKYCDVFEQCCSGSRNHIQLYLFLRRQLNAFTTILKKLGWKSTWHLLVHSTTSRARSHWWKPWRMRSWRTSWGMRGLRFLEWRRRCRSGS